MEQKAFCFDIKSAGDPPKGEFTGYAAVYGTKDRNEEIIDHGAMKRSIKANDGEFPLLWQHYRENPIGVVRLEETNHGAKAFGKINTAVAEGQKALSLMIAPEGFARGALRDLSIGYIVEKDEIKDSVRHLKEINVFEVSLVTIAAHPKTMVTSVKEYEDHATRITRLELSLKKLGATLMDEGLIRDPNVIRALIDALVVDADTAGNEEDDCLLREMIEDAELYNLRRSMT